MFISSCKSRVIAVLGFLLLSLGAACLSAFASPDEGQEPVSASAGENGALTLAEFEKLHQEVAFAKKGVWSIPWHVSLSEARAQAAREKKPIFLSLGSGNVLSTC